MYLPNYWTKLMLLSYLLVWLWSWYFWYFFSTWIWKHDEVSSSQIPSMPPLFLLCFLSLLLSFKEISGLCKKTKRMEKCSLRVAKYQTHPEQSKWSCISQWMLGPGLPGCAQCGSPPSQTSLCSRQERKYPRGFNTSGKIRNFIWAVSFTETGSHNRCRGIVLFDLPHGHKTGWLGRTGTITWSWLHHHRKL